MSDMDIYGHLCYPSRMNVHLTPELKKLVDDRVASGLYGSASEVIRAGLRLLDEEDRWKAEARRKVAEGVYAMVVPGSGLVKEQAEAEGLDRILTEAGLGRAAAHGRRRRGLPPRPQ